MSDQIGPKFIEGTFYENLPASDQSGGLPPPPLQLACDAKAPRVVLPDPGQIETGAADLRQAIERRRSCRRYAETALSTEELSFLLWCTQGVRQLQPDLATFRTVPSAGARHAFETYLFVNRVEGVASGLYRFLAIEHQLAEVRTGADLPGKLAKACFGQQFVATSAATFVWTAVAYRMTWRYGQRGYRYLLLDAGHVCQNLYLSAEAIDCGVCAVAAFDDAAVNRLLEIDGRKQFTVYLAAVGRKPSGP